MRCWVLSCMIYLAADGRMCLAKASTAVAIFAMTYVCLTAANTGQD